MRSIHKSIIWFGFSRFLIGLDGRVGKPLICKICIVPVRIALGLIPLGQNRNIESMKIGFMVKSLLICRI